MPSRWAPLWIVSLALVLSLGACRRDEAGASVAPVREPEPSPSAAISGDALAGPSGPPPRWEIDGTTLAAAPRLPLVLDQALHEFGRASDEVQDHVIVDINGDGQLDAVVLLPATGVAGAYDHLVLLSDGEAVRVHRVAELVPGASFSAAVVPLVDGPTLVAVAPRIGGCERGPEWTFLRPTGAMLETVGTVAIADYDCSVAEASIGFDRDPAGQVTQVVARQGEVVTRYTWDSALGSFAVAAE